MILAVQNHQKSTIRLLLANGAVLVPSILFCAVERGNLEIIDFLLEQGADINAEGGQGAPLTLAVSLNQLKTVEHLINKGANVNGQSSTTWSPLVRAAFEGYSDIAKVLLEHGADVDLRSSGDSPLHVAVRRGHLEVVELLIDYGANVNSLSSMGQTPLSMVKESPDIYYLLLHHGAEDFSVVESIGSVG